MKRLGLKILDIYIIKKFIGTYLFAILLIVGIAVVFDVAEKMDDFVGKGVPLKTIVFEYYVNFIPYFANLFSSLFTFIAVIFITSKMAYNSEIIAILSSGISFKRMLVPYFISAALIAIFSFLLSRLCHTSCQPDPELILKTHTSVNPFRTLNGISIVRCGLVCTFMQSYNTFRKPVTNLPWSVSKTENLYRK